ncbi:MAG: Mur ligase family protein [Actinomycetota bacterium]
MATPDPARLVELRVLEGPNVYFPRPAVKLTLAVPGWLNLSRERAERIGAELKLPKTVGAGEPGSQQRRRFVARVAVGVARLIARTAKAALAVRGRPGHEADEVVVAYPWRHRDAASALGEETVELLKRLLSARRPHRELFRESAARVLAVPPGDGPSLPKPKVPVVAVTGTNGKTTTVRLLAHLLGVGDRSVAYTSTDGVYLDGKMVEEGDYSGPAGAAAAIEQPGVTAAVLEVARGGILLKGIGVAKLDVAVVTNISADHLGLLGVFTLDQLAEVKAAITRIVKPDGWTVLNGDDPRVLGMGQRARGRPFVFSLDPDHPAIRWALSERGRGLAPLDGWLTLMRPRRPIEPLMPIEEIPMTLAGISGIHTQNAMAAAAAALGVGLSTVELVEGLRGFVLDPESNPGRANLFELDGRILVVDYAHNEAGMDGLVEICRGLRPPSGRIWIAYGTAGDRSDEVVHGMGYIAARAADRVGIVELHRYLRGRDPKDLIERLRAGAVDGGATDVPDFATEIEGLEWMLKQSSQGDVLGITALAQRPEIFELMNERGASRIGAERCLEIARAARKA